jgi:hypothetical protein
VYELSEMLHRSYMDRRKQVTDSSRESDTDLASKSHRARVKMMHCEIGRSTIAG